jgi:hypothetical protein
MSHARDRLLVAVSKNPPGTPRAGNGLEIEQIDYLRPVMQDENLTVDECDELSQILRQDAAAMPSGPRKENFLKLAEGYSALANLKRMVFREVNRFLSNANKQGSDVACWHFSDLRVCPLLRCYSEASGHSAPDPQHALSGPPRRSVPRPLWAQLPRGLLSGPSYMTDT